MPLSQTEKERLKSVLENVNGWSSPTAQWKRAAESWCRDRETTSNNVDVVRGVSRSSNARSAVELQTNLSCNRRFSVKWTNYYDANELPKTAFPNREVFVTGAWTRADLNANR